MQIKVREMKEREIFGKKKKEKQSTQYAGYDGLKSNGIFKQIGFRDFVSLIRIGYIDQVGR